MYSLRHIFLRVARTPVPHLHTIKDCSLNKKQVLSCVCREFSSRRDQGQRIDSERDDEDNYEEDAFENETRQKYGSSHRSTGFRQSQHRHRDNWSYPPGQRQSARFDDFDADFENTAEQTNTGFRRQTSDFGANIKDKEWNLSALPPLEKNFYVEHASLAGKSEADIDAFYKAYNITVTRGQRPIPVSHFSEANFPAEVSQSLEKNNWAQPTPIQSIGWPLALAGRNMVGIAQTGSGKTLGFMLPALVHIKHQRPTRKGEGPVVLVLAPTRELAQQIRSVAAEYGRPLGIRCCCLFGGQSKILQARQLSEDPQIIVATPGRLLDFLNEGRIYLDKASYVVLDEADRMLDMGFEPQIRKVLGQIRPDRQMLMWSATWPKEIRQLAHDFLGEFTQVNIGSVELMANPNIEQKILVCEVQEKFKLLMDELKPEKDKKSQKTLIFVQTKYQADVLTDKLQTCRIRALAIHGDKSQQVRDQTLQRFKQGQVEILVATDVASRGLDVNDIQLVVNYDYPNSADDYIHRIGRTARAEKTGKALTFVTSSDVSKVDDLIKVLTDAKQPVPNELLQLASSSNRRGSSNDRFNYHRKPYGYNRNFNRRNSW